MVEVQKMCGGAPLFETDFNFGKYGLAYYLMSKVLWNARLTAEQLDAIRDIHHPVEHTQAGVAHIIDKRAATHAETVRHSAGGGWLKIFPAHAAVEQRAEVARGETRFGERLLR